eukprot:3955640-Amphidinium_carterae.1
MFTLYTMMQQQALSMDRLNGQTVSTKISHWRYCQQGSMSKQHHYDFGLRNIKSVLNCAGSITASIK